jgi:hypothetical protein
VEAICAEATTGFERTGEVALVAQALERLEYHHESSWKSATIVTMLVNDFLVYTASNGKASREVVWKDGSKRKIFSNRAAGNERYVSLALSDSTKGYSRQFLADWALGFYDMIKQNALVNLRDEQMIQENQRLGAILEGLPPMQVN